jgi:hypothetical protein
VPVREARLGRRFIKASALEGAHDVDKRQIPVLKVEDAQSVPEGELDGLRRLEGERGRLGQGFGIELGEGGARRGRQQSEGHDT